MISQFTGRQTQFYIDLLYGLAFSLGFGYLLFVGMNPLIAAFQGGLVLGYFLRVWENMTVYERVLEEEVAAEAEAQVEAELDDAVGPEVEEQVAEELDDTVGSEVEEQVTAELDDQLPDEIEERVHDEVEEQVTAELDAQLPEEVETEVLARLREIDEELAAEIETVLRDGTNGEGDERITETDA